jgi:hypothetical protein
LPEVFSTKRGRNVTQDLFTVKPFFRFSFLFLNLAQSMFPLFLFLVKRGAKPANNP